MTIQLQDLGYLTTGVNKIETQIKIKTRNRELQDKRMRQLCFNYQIELRILWKSDPDRQEKEIYDSENRKPNRQWQKQGVIRDPRREVLIRVSRENEVEWSKCERKWIGSMK